MKDLTKFTVALDEFVKDLFNLETEEQVVNCQDGEIFSSLFMVTFGEEEGDEVGYISFNDGIDTSTLIRAAGSIIPYIEDGLELEVLVDQCHYLKTDKEGIVTEVLFEDDYSKTIKPTKAKK